MKINRSFAFLVSVSLVFTTLVSCVSNDDEILIPDVDTGYDGLANPKQVFENGMPKSINTMVIKTYNNGLVGQIVDRTTSVKFEYRPLFSSSSYDINMIVNKEDERKKYSTELNGKGFVGMATVLSDGSLNK